MIKDFLISFRDNFKDKTKNPFLGTYLIVWLIRNWELVYSLFNFNPKTTLQDKVDFVYKFYKNTTVGEELGKNALWAFSILILTYTFLSASRVIVNLFEKQLKPFIYKKTAEKGSTVLRSDYNDVKLERDSLQNLLEQEREKRFALEKRIQDLEIEKAPIINTTGSKQVEKKKNSLMDDITLEKYFIKLKEKNLLDEFKDIILKVKKGEPISKTNQNADYFLEQNLIDFGSASYDKRSNYYTLAPLGNDLLRHINLK